MSAYVSAVIVAAGGSVRMGIADSKQFIPLLDKPAIDIYFKSISEMLPYKRNCYSLP